MTLWLALALMTAAAIFAVLWPLSRQQTVRAGNDAAVYRDQLDEIARDRAAGLIGETEAEAARVEVSRRLIAAGDAQAKLPPASVGASVWRRRGAAIAALVFLPLLAGMLYLSLGSPQLPGAPLAARLQGDQSILALIAKIETHLQSDPKDARGWEVLAPVYLRLGRFDDAVTARRRAIEFGGETAQRRADLGEALVAAGNGIVTAEAKQAFDRAVALDGHEAKARFYLGMAAQQDGDTEKAAAIWQGMLKDAPPGAPWVAAVQQALASAGRTTAPGPNANDIEAASRMSDAERGEMVRGMVTRLADRLKQDGSDVDGWLRLLRAYMVLGERDKANSALGDARRALGSDAAKMQRVDELAKDLGLSG